MATVTITIPDEQVTRVLNAFAVKFRYDDTKETGETKAQFAQRMVRQFMIKTVRQVEADQAAQDARDAITLGLS